MSPAPAISDTQITRYEALAAVDGTGFVVAPACLLVRAGPGNACRLLTVGTPDQVRAHPAWAAATAVSLPSSVLIPGLVNTHTHLDLTHLGPSPYEAEGGFMGWVEGIRQGRRSDPEGIAASVRLGIELAEAGGTVAVGDIAGAPLGRPSLVPFATLRDSALAGVSFVEFFGIGNRLGSSADRLDALAIELGAVRAGAVRPGLQPHAPNTVDLDLYLRTAAHAARLPLATHLAETLDEREFVSMGTGPQRRLLERLGIWDDSVLGQVGKGLGPVQHLAPALAAAPFLVAHVNDCDDAAIQTLARTGTGVAYCPRASAYFGAERHFGPHRYRDLIRAGVNVSLGTDSIVNLPPAAADPAAGGISILHEMRFLFDRDGTDPLLLLRMATINGARALRLPGSAFTFEPGAELAGVVAVGVDRAAGADPARAILTSGQPPRLLRGGGRTGAGQ